MTYSKSITIRQLEVLHGIASAGSIRRAAQVMELTQPTISAQLAKMEGILGTKLVNRDSTRATLLTGAGELWAETASRVLSELELGQQSHSEQFGQNTYKMSFVTIPSQAGNVLGLVAELAEMDPNIADLSVQFSASSKTALDFMSVRKASIGLMRMSAELRALRNLRIEPLYDDRILWAVPVDVDPDLVARVIRGEPLPDALPKPLRTRVSIESIHEWRVSSDAWYKTALPEARPYFSCDLHVSAIEIVAAQLATCHISMAHYSNLPERIHETVAFYDLGRPIEAVVLAMPRHLMAIPTFVTYFEGLAAAVRENYEARLAAAPPVRSL